MDEQLPCIPGPVSFLTASVLLMSSLKTVLLVGRLSAMTQTVLRFRVEAGLSWKI